MTNNDNIRFVPLTVMLPFLLAFLFYGIHSYYNNQDNKSSALNFNLVHFEDVLHNHQRVMASTLKQITYRAGHSDGHYSSCIDGKKDLQYSYYLFNNDSLVTWRNAAVAPDSLVNFKKPSVALFPNGWYLVQPMIVDSIKAYGLFCIKNSYAYENEYLFESFNSSFNISSIPDIVSSPINDGFQVRDAEGNFLMSLRFNELKPLWSSNTGIGLIAFFLFVISLVIFIGNALRFYVLSLSKSYTLLLGFLLLLITYISLLSVRFSSAILSYSLMSPSAFALSWWMPSLGFLLILSFFIFIWGYWFYSFFDGFIFSFLVSSDTKKIVKVSLSLLMSGLFYAIIHIAISLLVNNSRDLSFYVEPIDFSWVMLSKLLIFCFLIFSFILVADKLTSLLVSEVSARLSLTFSVALGAAAIILLIVFVNSFLIISAVSFFVVFIIVLTVKQRNVNSLNYGLIVSLVFLFSISVVLRISYLTKAKESSNRSLLIQNLSFKLMREDDPVAEMFLLQLENSIISDKFISDNISSEIIETTAIGEYLRKNYFEGYFSRYDLQVIPCRPESELNVTGHNLTYNCYSFFQSMLYDIGSRLSPTSSFYFLRDGDGLSTYFGQFQYVDSVSGDESHLYLEINSKPYFVGMGYPELLINKRDRLNIEQYGGYSYGKYVNGKLVSRFGDFEYHLSDQWIGDNRGDYAFFDKDGYSHLLFHSGDNQFVVLSYPLLTFKQLTSNFSLVFIVTLVFVTILYLLTTKTFGANLRHISIQERIRFSFVGILIVLLIAMCGVTLMATLRDFENGNNNLISQKLNSVIIDLQHVIGKESALGADDYDYLNQQLQKSSNVFFTDINLYGVDGRLLGTSRSELFSKGVVSPLMSNTAFCAIAHNETMQYIHSEKIGTLQFLSGYAPFYNYDNQLIGYVNIPYFVGTRALHQQLSAVLVTILSTYLFFILFAVVVAIFFSRRIAAPLIAIRENIKGVELGKQNAKIKYSGGDEIGALVIEYNRMLDELAVSAEKLAMSERESTWREMAKQVAHEINNPLTPMKLSVQYLQKAWDDQRADYSSYMSRVTDTLIEQIDQLSIIASEFSAFAKMPAMNLHHINLVEKLKRSVLLFSQETDVEISFNANGVDELMIYADGEQLGSVFNNLLKNAVQSIGNNGNGHIDVSLDVSSNKAVIAIEDNGQGIDPGIREKIFKPNFSTKSTGMGIGLAIVKNIVTSLNGKIWFDTALGKGSTFYISLPLFNRDKS